MRAGSGSHRIAAGVGGRRVGSVLVGFAQAGVHPRGYPLLRAPINRVLAGVMQGRMVPATPVRVAAAPAVSRDRGATVQRAAANVIQRAEFFTNEIKSSYSGRNDSGVVFGDSPVLRPARPCASDENARFLRYVSNFFFHYVNQFVKAKDQEVEAMFLSDRLVISANNPTTMKKLFEVMKTEKTLLEFLQTQLPSSVDTRGTQMADRFYDVISRPDPRSEAAQLLQAISFEDIADVVRLIEVTRLKDAITGSAYSEKLILLSGLGIHAEQKLLLALVDANPSRTIDVAIRGKKRPCFGCWLCLTFVKEVLGFANLSYNTKGGKAWVGSVDSLDRLLEKARQAGVSADTIEKWFKQKQASFSTVKTHVSTNRFGQEDAGYDSYSDDDPF